MCRSEPLNPWFIQIDSTTAVPVHRICVIRQTKANYCEIAIEGWDTPVGVLGTVEDIREAIAAWLLERGIRPNDAGP